MCVYSIGYRCGTEMILKRLGLTRFSSVFGSCCIGTIEKVIECLETKFDVLFNSKNLIYSKDIDEFQELNREHGNRTLHILYDDLKDWHSATIAHHDMSDEKVKDHFERAVTRFYKLLWNRVPTLFIYTGPAVNFEKCVKLVNIMSKENNPNFHILFCFFVENSPITKIYNDEHMSIYNFIHEDRLDQILADYDLSSLITIDEIDRKYLFIH